MASNDRRPTDHNASIALLRRVRAGEDVHFVHRVDVCDAPPEVLVANLEPVPGTGVNDGGDSSVWYFYHAKKFTNKQGKLSGYRQRAVTDGGGAAWHSELSRKAVQGSGGGTSCTFSYGLKPDPSARSIHRLGWCMTEYDIADADKKEIEDATAASNHVLCKVYRSPRAKEKSASTSSSSKKSKTTRKRKAGGGDHPEAPPAKLIQQQEPQQVQQEVAVQQPLGPGGDFNSFNIDDINFYVDESMLRAEPEVGVQQPAAGPGAESEHCHGGINDSNIEDFNVGEFLDILETLRDEPVPVPVPEPGLQQQPIAEPEHDDARFIQLLFGPALATEATIDDTTTYGHCSSYAPSWLHTSATGCSSGGFFKLKDMIDPLQAPAFLSHSHVLTGAQGYYSYYC